MHKLEQIKEEVIEKIESNYKDHPNLEPAVLDYLDKLAHFGKNLGKLCESNDEGFSMRGSNESNRSYADGMSHGYMPFVYAGESYGGEAYRKRDSMGRFSRDGYSRDYSRDGYSQGTWDTVNKIEDLIREAPDEQTRQELQRIAGRMRNG